MNPKKYLIIYYTWEQPYYDYEKFETNSFMIMLLKFFFLKLKYDIVDIYYRKGRN